MFRAARSTEAYLHAKTETGEQVAPGSYKSLAELAPPIKESSAPFQSLQEKVLNPIQGTARITPGPGTYVGQKLPETSGFMNDSLGISKVAFKSATRRLAPSAPGSTVFKASTIEDNPGPGTYTMEVQSPKKELMGAKVPVLEVQEKKAPSIPIMRLLPGQDPETEAAKLDHAVLMSRHTGEPGDLPGPGDYEPKSTLLHKVPPQTVFHPSAKQRQLWEPTVAIDSLMPPRENPGPGTYNALTGEIVEKLVKPGEAAHTYQFASKALLHYQTETPVKKRAPGPGHYEVGLDDLGTVAKQIKDKSVAAGDSHRFGSMTDRIGWSRPVDMPFKDPYNRKHVPGPGHYPDQDLQFPVKLQTPEVEKALPPSMQKKLHGIHHPSLLLALQDAQGPMHAFHTTGVRPCNKPGDQTTPAPGEYRRENAQGASMTSALTERAKIGRKGVFGTCADRFYGSPLNGKTGLPDPGVDQTDGIGSPRANSEPKAVFQSQTPRFPQPAGPKEVLVTSVGKHETPGPGAFDVLKEPSYRSPFRVPRQEHLSFGVSQGRFAGKDIFDGQGPPASNPGPGDYVPPSRKNVVGAAKIQAKRGLDPKDLKPSEVGPGTYGQSIETTMLKKTFNVSTQAPITPHTKRASKRSFGTSGVSM